MPKIPLYSSSGKAADRSNTAMAGGNVMAAPSLAIARAGAAMTEVGVLMEGKAQDLKRKADIADYETSRVKFESDLAEAKTNYMLDPTKSYQDVQKDVFEPMLNEFGASLDTRGYSSDTIDGIKQRWGLDSATLIASEEAERRKMQITDHAMRVRDNAFSLINNGNMEEGFAELDSLSGIVGQEKVSSWKQQGIYDKNMRELANLSDPDAIEEKMASKEIRDQLTPAQYQSFLRVGDSQIRSITQAVYAPVKKEFTKLFSAGELTPEQVKASPLPENEKKFFFNSINKSIGSGIALNKESYDKGSKLVDNWMDGSYGTWKNSKDSYNDLLNDIQKLELPPDVELELMRPIIDGQGNIEVNAPFYIKKDKWNAYDKGVRIALNKYRSAHGAATKSMPASVRMAEFGIGYSKVYEWAKENKSALLNNTYDEKELNMVIREAAYPAIKARLDMEAKKRNTEILTGSTTALYDEEALLNSFDWSK